MNVGSLVFNKNTLFAALGAGVIATSEVLVPGSGAWTATVLGFVAKFLGVGAVVALTQPLVTKQ